MSEADIPNYDSVDISIISEILENDFPDLKFKVHSLLGQN